MGPGCGSVRRAGGHRLLALAAALEAANSPVGLLSGLLITSKAEDFLLISH